MSKQFGLQSEDLSRITREFGVAEPQVRRDHAVSHILAALSRSHRDDLIFFGKTALSRTYLVDERLSEDTDLIAASRRNDMAEKLSRLIPSALARTHGRVTWAPGWSPADDVLPATAVTPAGIAVKIQLLAGTHYAK